MRERDKVLSPIFALQDMGSSWNMVDTPMAIQLKKIDYSSTRDRELSIPVQVGVGTFKLLHSPC